MPSTKKLNFSVDERLHRALMVGRLDDGVSVSDRIRALISLWERDENQLKSAVLEESARLAVEENRPQKT